jgi:hypothetical protein
MAILLSNFIYFFYVFLNLAAFVLVLEWFFYFMPGQQLNGIRKTLFNLSFPLLSCSERFFSIRWGRFHSRGLLMAFLFWMLGYLGLPWLILYSYSLRG